MFVHLPRPADKLAALLAMTGKVYALAAGLVAEDSADALSAHEALLPGQLLAKFTADKLAEALVVFRRQVGVLGSVVPELDLQEEVEGLCGR